jgi:hypothetical protein
MMYFTDIFEVDPGVLDEYGAFNVSLLTDLPLFIDPFLLFNSVEPEYSRLHDEIIRYLRFLRDMSGRGGVGKEGLRTYYHFKEVKETCLGFCEGGHAGRGLGASFARALNGSLESLLDTFGRERITQGSHLEKLCLIAPGVGKDMISDFTTNLINGYLCQYTETFAKQHIESKFLKPVPVTRAFFNFETRSWVTRRYELPWRNRQYVLLTPKDILTRDDTWINKSDMVHDFDQIPQAIENEALRGQINEYFRLCLPLNPEKKDREKAAIDCYRKFPELIDYFIKRKEETGDDAVLQSREKVLETENGFGVLLPELRDLLNTTAFFKMPRTTIEECRVRIAYFKDVIENKGGHTIFKHMGNVREADVQMIFRFCWYATTSDISREVNDGRGPVDFKISRGAHDKTVVEFKLASNTHLRTNLKKQLPIYKAASDAQHALYVILFFTDAEVEKLERLLNELGLVEGKHVVLIDARSSNKPSASKA